jgi:hypothetical protein
MPARSNRKVTKPTTVHATKSRRGRLTGATHRKPVSSDQAPGEETVQVNDKYTGGGPPPAVDPSEHFQHQTGG